MYLSSHLRRLFVPQVPEHHANRGETLIWEDVPQEFVIIDIA